MITSGAPLPAEIAVWNFAYSGAPWPATVQQTWTSLWALLKLSTTVAMFGYHAQTETCGALFIILLLQLVSLGLLALSAVPLPLELHAASVTANAMAEIAANAFFLTVFPS